MLKLSSAQQIVNQLVPNIAGQATDLVQAFKGGFSGGVGAEANLLDSQSAFGSQLQQATSRDEISFDRKDSRDFSRDRASISESSSRDEAYAPPKSSSPQRDALERRDDGGSDNVAATSRTRNETQSNNKRSEANDNQVDSKATTRASENNTTDANEEPIGKAGELLEDAKELLGKLEEFQAANPEIAADLLAILAPIQQSLQQIIQQLSGLQPGTTISAAALEGSPGDALAQLKQLASLFNGLQSGGSLESLAQKLSGGAISEEFSQALKSLQQVDGETLSKVNQLVESFRQLVSKPAQESLAPAANDPAKGQPIGQQSQSALQAPVVAAINQETNASGKGELATTEARLNVGNQPVANNGQSSNQGGANQQNGQGFNQNNAQAQALQQQKAQVAAGGVKLDAPTSQQTTTSSSPQVSQANGAINTTTLTREAANFEQILKQANRPPPAEQIQVKIKSMVKNGQSKISMTLDPVELGKVEIKMQIDRAARTQLLVSVERPATLELLQRDSRILMQALQDAGLKADGGSLSFNLSSGNDSSSGNGQQAKNVYPTAEEHFDDEMLSVVSENYTVELEQGVNIHA